MNYLLVQVQKSNENGEVLQEDVIAVSLTTLKQMGITEALNTLFEQLDPHEPYHGCVVKESVLDYSVKEFVLDYSILGISVSNSVATYRYFA